MAHAPNPRDSSRLSTWLRLRRIDSIFAFAAHHCACRHTQPRARLRLSKASSSLRLAQELRTLCIARLPCAPALWQLVVRHVAQALRHRRGRVRAGCWVCSHADMPRESKSPPM
jgi:hypothetical protein